MKSMTGFGRAETILGSHQLTVEIKSVNHRFLDLRFRLPPGFSAWESEISELVRKHCERGSLEIFLRQKLVAEKGLVTGTTRFAVDENALESLLKATTVIEAKTQQKFQLSLMELLQTGKIVVALEDTDEKMVALENLMKLFSKALENLVLMRTKEGASLKKVMRGITHEMRQDLAQISQLSPQQGEKIREKLQTRLNQWKLQAPIDSQRLEWEVAILAEKSDITEEIDRLNGHFEALDEAFESSKSIGRKLDFLTQELHREVNTIASKTTLIEITQLTVRLKSNIEKLREQVQNVE